MTPGLMRGRAIFTAIPQTHSCHSGGGCATSQGARYAIRAWAFMGAWPIVMRERVFLFRPLDDCVVDGLVTLANFAPLCLAM